MSSSETSRSNAPSARTTCSSSATSATVPTVNRTGTTTTSVSSDRTSGTTARPGFTSGIVPSCRPTSTENRATTRSLPAITTGCRMASTSAPSTRSARPCTTDGNSVARPTTRSRTTVPWTRGRPRLTYGIAAWSVHYGNCRSGGTGGSVLACREPSIIGWEAGSLRRSRRSRTACRCSSRSPIAQVVRSGGRGSAFQSSVHRQELLP